MKKDNKPNLQLQKIPKQLYQVMKTSIQSNAFSPGKTSCMRRDKSRFLAEWSAEWQKEDAEQFHPRILAFSIGPIRNQRYPHPMSKRKLSWGMNDNEIIWTRRVMVFLSSSGGSRIQNAIVTKNVGIDPYRCWFNSQISYSLAMDLRQVTFLLWELEFSLIMNNTYLLGLLCVLCKINTCKVLSTMPST